MKTAFFTGDSIHQTYHSSRVRITSLTKDGVTRQVDLRTYNGSAVDLTLAQPYLWKIVDGELLHIGEVVWAKEKLQSRIWAAVPGERFSRIVALVLASPIFWIPKILRLQKFKPTHFAEWAELRQGAAKRRLQEAPGRSLSDSVA